jgi:hypothetical protein
MEAENSLNECQKNLNEEILDDDAAPAFFYDKLDLSSKPVDVNVQINDNSNCVTDDKLNTVNKKVKKFQNQYGEYFGQVDENGKRDGYGIFKFPSGHIHKGEWKNDMLNGYCIIYFEDGRINYEGEIKDNSMNGIGIHRGYLGIDVYHGEFNSNGMRNGVGTLYRNNQIFYQGEMNQGAKKGYGILYSETGQPWFEGVFEEGKGVLNLKKNIQKKKNKFYK